MGEQFSASLSKLRIDVVEYGVQRVAQSELGMMPTATMRWSGRTSARRFEGAHPTFAVVVQKGAATGVEPGKVFGTASDGIISGPMLRDRKRRAHPQ